MKVADDIAEVFVVLDAPKLDPITVIIQNRGANAGRLIVECYGQAWACFFGGTGERFIADFIAGLDASYLAGKLRPSAGKFKRSDDEYLVRVAGAVIAGMRMRTGLSHQIK